MRLGMTLSQFLKDDTLACSHTNIFSADLKPSSWKHGGSLIKDVLGVEFSLCFDFGFSMTVFLSGDSDRGTK